MSESEAEKRRHRDAVRAFDEMFSADSEARQTYWIVEPT